MPLIAVPRFIGARRGPDATVSKTDNSVQTANQTIYTFNTQSIGVADTARKVVVGVRGGGADAVSTVVVNGVSASLVVAVAGDEGELWQADVPTDTSVTIVVTFAGATSSCGIGVWRVLNAKSEASDTASSTADPMNATLTIPAGGVAIGYGGDESTSTYTWTNLTEDFDETTESARDHTGASDAFATLQTSRSITCDPSNAAAGQGMVLAAWNKA